MKSNERKNVDRAEQLRAVVYAEQFGISSEVWMWRQVRAAGTPVLTHQYRLRETFAHHPVWVVPKRRSLLDRAGTLIPALRRNHGYRLPPPAERDVIARLRTEGATLLHAHFGPAGLRMLPVTRELKIPLIVTFHGFDITKLPARDPAYRRELAGLFDAAWCIAVSTDVRERLERLGCTQVRTLPLGTPIGDRVPRTDTGRLRILTVARLIARKGIPDLIDAVRAMDGDVELHVVGDGPDRANVEAQAGGDSRIVLHGALPPDAVAEHFAKADVFVLNSRELDDEFEAFGIVLVEAMAAGLPVIGTRHGGIPEAVVDGETGILIAERATEDLQTALESLARDPELRARMGNAGRRRVEQHFEIGACTRQLLEMYDAVFRASQ